MPRLSLVSLITIPMLLASNSSSLADDARLDAALKRIELLEGKLDKLTALGSKIENYAAIEQENRQLRARLNRLETTKEKTNNPKRQEAKIDQAKPVLATYSAEKQYSEPNPASTNWSGIYAGINAGYGKGSYSQKNFEFYNTFISSNSSTPIIEGPFVGGQIGYNYQLDNNLILGFETDIDYSDIRSDSSGYSDAYNIGVDIFSINNYGSFYGRTGLDWLGTVRARVGYSMDKFMPYFTAGLAYGGVSSVNNSNQFFSYFPAFALNVSQRSSDIQGVTLGWSAGAGAEFMVTDQWSVKAEYLYSSIGGISSTYPISSRNSVINSFPRGINRESLGSFDVHQARFGLNFHTGWLASEPLPAR